MRTTINIDDELIAAAIEYTGIEDRAALVRHAMKTLVAVEAGRRLARLGGSDPTAEAAPRRRPPRFVNE
ncbi:type II toxin-antitoxin system VapB family antitoxin [Sphingomonas sp.]|jgi:Arc/MetJ family transcription regulator|uniref:type II toxin-antitoxin system VapB family antitoxin n=1 Tax=Sphingomonas sp. TaxID=28214 RepID=UPI002D803BEA|nr:type II toxin-antitoxin system VapB family antitoxin [Sphingomonas sp.]HEU0044377.1 type II toxin-antitoxin system VapB family antitoxin [Sphingomonas sp.]